MEKVNRKSIIEWVEIKEDKDLPPHGWYLVRYGDGSIGYKQWIPKTVSFDWGWFDTDGDLCLPPRYYCRLKDIIEHTQ